MGVLDLGRLLRSSDFNGASKDSRRFRTTAAGARPNLPSDSKKCWGKVWESTVCEPFSSSHSPSENNHENALCLKYRQNEPIIYDHRWLWLPYDNITSAMLSPT